MRWPHQTPGSWCPASWLCDVHFCRDNYFQNRQLLLLVKNRFRRSSKSSGSPWGMNGRYKHSLRRRLQGRWGVGGREPCKVSECGEAGSNEGGTSTVGCNGGPGMRVGDWNIAFLKRNKKKGLFCTCSRRWAGLEGKGGGEGVGWLRREVAGSGATLVKCGGRWPGWKKDVTCMRWVACGGWGGVAVSGMRRALGGSGGRNMLNAESLGRESGGCKLNLARGRRMRGGCQLVFGGMEVREGTLIERNSDTFAPHACRGGRKHFFFNHPGLRMFSQIFRIAMRNFASLPPNQTLLPKKP